VFSTTSRAAASVLNSSLTIAKHTVDVAALKEVGETPVSDTSGSPVHPVSGSPLKPTSQKQANSPSSDKQKELAPHGKGSHASPKMGDDDGIRLGICIIGDIETIG
jgi:hypothetical protein